MKKNINTKNVKNFAVMQDCLTLQDAIKESSRCLLCQDAPCSRGCPGGTDPGKFIRQIRFLNFKGAARTIRNNNILASVCSFICPTEKLCEEKCSACALEDPININGLQRFAWEYGKHNSLEPFERSSGELGKVAVIGAGPAGLSCAAELAKKGAEVTIFEKDSSAGGVAAWGIPSYRLAAEALDYDIRNLLDLGVEIKYNSKIVGKDACLDLLAKGYKAVFIGTGLSQPFELPNLTKYDNVTNAVDFLTKVKKDRNSFDFKGKNIVVIGGGSVAMDSAVSAASLNPKKVYAIALESLPELPADKEEIELAHLANVIFKAGCQVKDVISEDNKVIVVKGIEIELPEKNNFSYVIPLEGTEFNLRADFIIQAIGAKPGSEIAEFADGLKYGGKGIIKVNDDFSTDVPGIFAAGDIVNGGATMIRAVGDGKTAALSIVEYIMGGK